MSWTDASEECKTFRSLDASFNFCFSNFDARSANSRSFSDNTTDSAWLSQHFRWPPANFDFVKLSCVEYNRFSRVHRFQFESVVCVGMESADIVFGDDGNIAGLPRNIANYLPHTTNLSSPRPLCICRIDLEKMNVSRLLEWMEE